MDWNNIKSKYHKAWSKLLDYHENKVVGLIDHPDVWSEPGLDIDHWELRHLYDFFDENEIYINVDAKCALDNSTLFIGYIWSIVPDVDKYVENESQSRKYVELACFDQAFEILEDKLSN